MLLRGSEYGVYLDMIRTLGIIAASVFSTLLSVWVLPGDSAYPAGTYFLVPVESEFVDSLDGWVKFIPCPSMKLPAVKAACNIEIQATGPDGFSEGARFDIELLDSDGFVLWKFRTENKLLTFNELVNVKYISNAIPAEQAKLVSSATIKVVVGKKIDLDRVTWGNQ